VSNVRNKIRAAGVAVLAIPLLVGAGSPASAATNPPAGAYADAYGLTVDVTALSGAVPVQVPEQARAASSCPPAGGTKSNSILEIPGDPLANVKAAHDTATTDCVAKSSKAESRIVDADALIDTPAFIHADAITATSTTSCTAAPKGSLDVVNLVVGGTNITEQFKNGIPPNTKVLDPVLSLLGLTVILNEQHPASLGRGLVVNGVHVIASGTGAIPIGGAVIRGDIIIAHAVSGVVCPGGPGTDNGGLPKPDISFYKGASPSAADPGDTVTYTATITNQSTTPCEVLKFVDHIAPAFTLVSTSGPLGTALEKPAPSRVDGGVDAVLRPTAVVIGAGKSITQLITVTVKDDATPGTYYDTLEIFCGPNGDFVSGPLAPVTVPGNGVTPPPVTVEEPPTTPAFAPTGLNTGVPILALLLLAAAVGTRRLVLNRRDS
jgi:uncharacterized repeat protein (TIGR01451 family)